MVKKQLFVVSRCGDAAHPSFMPIERGGLKLRENSKGAKGEGDGADLALIEFCTDSGQIHLGSSLHRNPHITSEYKTPEA